MKVTAQQRSKWIKAARDAKCEGLIITLEKGDDRCYPYHVAYRHQMNYMYDQLMDEGYEIIEEIFI